MLIAPPATADYGFYNGYVTKAPKTDLITALKENWNELESFVGGLSDEQLLLRYEAGKWNIKEVLAHLIDAERNFCYRIMRISRGDQAQLPMFSVHEFVVNSFATERSRESLMHELELVRKCTIAMYEGMHPSMLDKTGPARDVIISVRALGFAIAGHVTHHVDIIKERYL
ncbi:MAG: DinB family protein [Flavipsychrobacter sp.]|nr:DinB family protein [Flavipsychrobacter sp.]